MHGISECHFIYLKMLCSAGISVAHLRTPTIRDFSLFAITITFSSFPMFAVNKSLCKVFKRIQVPVGADPVGWVGYRGPEADVRMWPWTWFHFRH